jgi:hypothetical protein
MEIAFAQAISQAILWKPARGLKIFTKSTSNFTEINI